MRSRTLMQGLTSLPPASLDSHTDPSKLSQPSCQHHHNSLEEPPDTVGQAGALTATTHFAASELSSYLSHTTTITATILKLSCTSRMDWTGKRDAYEEDKKPRIDKHAGYNVGSQ